MKRAERVKRESEPSGAETDETTPRKSDNRSIFSASRSRRQHRHTHEIANLYETIFSVSRLAGRTHYQTDQTDQMESLVALDGAQATARQSALHCGMTSSVFQEMKHSFFGIFFSPRATCAWPSPPRLS